MVVVFAFSVLAKPVEKVIEPQSQPEPLVGVFDSLAKAAVDTTYLLGGPDRWDGSFETPGGVARLARLDQRGSQRQPGEPLARVRLHGRPASRARRRQPRHVLRRRNHSRL